MTIDLEFDEAAYAAKMAKVAAEFTGTFLMTQHRGVLDCGDHFVVFGNDGYSDDPRSQREAAIVLEHFKSDSPVLGVCEEGYSWAIVVTDYSRPTFDAERLRKIVWDAWMVACDEANYKEEGASNE
jgi:hypothetical protein